MRTRSAFVLLFLGLMLTAFGQQTKGDTIRMRLKDPSVADTAKLMDVIAYTFKWPRPTFDELIKLIDEAYVIGTNNKRVNLCEQLLGCKVRLYTENNRGIEAFSICQEMKKLGETEHKDRIIAQSYYLRGNIFQSYNMLGKAIEEQKIANEYFAKANDLHGLANGRYLLGWYSFNHKDYQTSIKSFIPAYNYMLKNRSTDLSVLGEYSGWIGNTYGALKKFDSAIYYRRLSLNYFEKANDRFGFSDAYRYLGNIYRNMKNYDSAMVNYQRSYNLFSEYKIMDRKWLLQYFIAETYAALKDYKRSAKELDNLLDTVNGTKDLLSLLWGNGLGGKVYDKNKEYQKAISCFKKYIIYKDSSEKTGQQGAVTELDAKLKFEQEESAMKLRQAEKDAVAAREKEKQVMIRNFFMVGFIVMAGFVLLIYKNYKQKKAANKLLEKQKNEIEHQKKEIQDSINYAQNIQTSILPDLAELQNNLGDMFVFYKPKDVVSGDFFWYCKHDNKILLAAADCTGHGVPGAFMSMIGSYELNNSVLERGLIEPSRILSHINVSLKKRLKQTSNQSAIKDGMDIALCSFDLKGNSLQYAGANRPLFIVRGEETIEIAPTKAAIGGFTSNDFEFLQNTFELKKGDCVYMYTDGYSDQFGGDKNKKLTTKRFKELLKQIATRPMREQLQALEENFYKWKGNFDQLDDVLVIGIRI